MKYFLICVLFISNVYAAELEVGLMTHHWFTRGLNEDNQLLGIEIANVEASTFVNSYEDRSWSIGYRYKFNENWSISGGLIEGYQENAKLNPCHFDDIVCYVFLNYSLPIDPHFGIRARTTGHLLLLNFYLNFN